MRFGLYLFGRGLKRLREHLPQRLQWILSPWTIATASVGLVGMAVWESLEVNPITGRRQLCLVSREELATMSNMAEEEYIAQLTPHMAPNNQREVKVAKRVLERLSRNPAVQGMHFRLYYINQHVTQAFVLPNGAVFLFHGLVELVEGNEDALACILSHEICHVVARHGQERVSFDYIWAFLETSMWLALGMFGVPFLAPIIGGAVSNFCEKVIYAPHSRDNEREADRLGMYMASEACYNPRAAPQVWRRFQEADIPEGVFNSTHPPHAEREQNLRHDLDDVLLCSAPHHCGVQRWPSVGQLFAAMRSVF